MSVCGDCRLDIEHLPNEGCRTPGLHRVGAGRPSNTVEHPFHYNKHPSGIECIQVVQWFGFNIGNAIKYLWRADLKDNAIEDLQKARQYIDFELAKRAKSIGK